VQQHYKVTLSLLLCTFSCNCGVGSAR